MQHHITWYPTIWITGFGILGIMWWELRSEVHRTYVGLNTDTVTQAKSRSFGELYASNCLADQALGLVYADIDRFKGINDAFGHTVGDRILQEVVHRIRWVCRDQDHIVRLGGDEFLVIFPGVCDSDASGILARIAAAVSQPPIAFPDVATTVGSSLSISLGWTWGSKGSDFTQLVELADSAMYAEKRRHRTDESTSPFDILMATLSQESFSLDAIDFAPRPGNP